MSRDMSQVSQLVNSYRSRKEAAATRIRRQTTKNSSQPPMTFRRDSLGTFFEEDNEFQEQQGEDELLLDPSGKYDRISDDDKFETENVAVSSDMIAHSAKMCPIQLGFALSQTPAEQMSDFNRRLRAKMACRLNLDYSHVDELAAHNCPEIRALAFGLRGMMKLFEIQVEKSLVKPKDSEVEKLTAVFDPKLFREMEHLEVQNLEKNGTIDINLIFSNLTSQSSSLRHVVHTCANHWIKSVVPANLVKNFSTSTVHSRYQTVSS